MNPEELRYAKTHEWVHIAQEDGSQLATIGISAYAVEALTDLVLRAIHLELPEKNTGKQVQAGDTLGEVESVKAVSDLYSPVSGEVVRGQLGTAGCPGIAWRRYVRSWLDCENSHDRRGAARDLDGSCCLQCFVRRRGSLKYAFSLQHARGSAGDARSDRLRVDRGVV